MIGACSGQIVIYVKNYCPEMFSGIMSKLLVPQWEESIFGSDSFPQKRANVTLPFATAYEGLQIMAKITVT